MKRLLCALVAARRLRVLTPHTDAPVVPDTTVGPDLLQALEVVTELLVEVVGQHLREFAVLGVLLPVKEPVRDPVLARVLHHGDELLHVVLGEFTSALVDVNLSHLAAQDGVPAAATLDGRQGVDDLLHAVKIRVHDTNHVLEVLGHHERHG